MPSPDEASFLQVRVQRLALEFGATDPGKVFDLTLPLEQVAEGYRAMDGRRAIKALLIP